MSRSSLGRLGLLLVSLLGLLSLFSASAFAAGKPTSVNVGNKLAATSLTHTEMWGAANPNGAATTISLEYGLAGVYQTLLTKEIGSGTTSVQVYGLLNGLQPQTWYGLRVSATNSFGTTYSTVKSHETKWVVDGQPEYHGAQFSSSGTFKLEYKAGTVSVKIECKESGYGTLGHEKSVGDAYHLTASGCVDYQNGKEVCKPKSITLNMNAAFKAENEYLTICPGEEVQHSLSFLEAFFVTVPFEKSAVIHPLTMTMQAYLDSNLATVTISSNWQLSGADIGTKFAVVYL